MLTFSELNQLIIEVAGHDCHRENTGKHISQMKQETTLSLVISLPLFPTLSHTIHSLGVTTVFRQSQGVSALSAQYQSP